MMLKMTRFSEFFLLFFLLRVGACIKLLDLGLAYLKNALSHHQNSWLGILGFGGSVSEFLKPSLEAVVLDHVPSKQDTK